MKNQKFLVIGGVLQLFALILSILLGIAIGYWMCMNTHVKNPQTSYNTLLHVPLSQDGENAYQG